MEHDDKPFYQERNDIKSYVFSQVHVNEGWKKIIIWGICLHLGGDDIYSILSIFTILLWIMFCSFVNTKVQEVKA